MSTNPTLCFNSIKVRVKHPKLFNCDDGFAFQFHKGTSKTVFLVQLILTFRCFNSIKVRVKLMMMFCLLMSIVCFNSIKVRVKHMSRHILFSSPLFQFHKGTSKTRYDYYCPEFDNLFQFHKGTSKTVLVLVPL